MGAARDGNEILLSVPEMTDAPHTGPLRGVLRNPVGVTSLAFLVLVALVALFAPLLTKYGPNVVSPNAVLAPPGGSHLLGGDSSGRDVLSRLVYGARYSLGGALLATSLAVVLGVGAGLLAGYYRGWPEIFAGSVSDVLMALPSFIVLLAASTVVGPSTWTIMIILAVLFIPAFYRLVVNSVIAVRAELFIDAARVSGLRDRAIIGRHILNAVRLPVVIQWSLLAGITVAIQAGLDFLGVDNPQAPTWGNLLSDGFSHMYQRSILLLWPSLAIGFTSLAFVLFGNALRDELARTIRPRRARPVQPGPQVAPAAVAVLSHPEPPREKPVLLSVQGLSVGYDRPDGSTIRVVQDVSLDVRAGEVHGLIGESGSGKTQTAWAVLDLLPRGGRILSGTVAFAGQSLTSRQGRRALQQLRGRRIGYVPQEPMSNLDPAFTVGAQIVEPLRVHMGMSRARARSRAIELLSEVGIADPVQTFAAYPHELSGGMAQRALIAGAIACKPDLLIADEPTSALDVTIQAEILDLLRSLTEELELAVVLVTHNFGVVADLCHTMSVMQKGRIVEKGPVRSVFSDPRDPYTRSLFDSVLDTPEPDWAGPPAQVDV